MLKLITFLITFFSNLILLFSQADIDSNITMQAPKEVKSAPTITYTNTIDPIGTINTILVAVSILVGIFGLIITVLLVIINNRAKETEKKINELKIKSTEVELQLSSIEYMKKNVNLLMEEHKTEHGEMITLMDEKTKRLDNDISEMIRSISKINSKTLLIDEFIRAEQFNAAKRVIKEIYKNDSFIKENRDLKLNLEIYKSRIYIEDKKNQDIDKALRHLKEANKEFEENPVIYDLLGQCYFLKCNDCLDQDQASGYIIKALEWFNKILKVKESDIASIQTAQLNIAEGHLIINEFEKSLEKIHEIELDDDKENDLDKPFIEAMKLIIFNEQGNLDKKDELKTAFKKEDFELRINIAIAKYLYINKLLLRLKESFEKFKKDNKE